MPTTSIIPSLRPLIEAPILRWGILGAGGIAGHFVDALHRRTKQNVTAVGSRSPGRAELFATAHGIPVFVDSAEALVTRQDVDIAYIATPHDTHRHLAELALHAGKHVLLEKPLATTAADARAILALADSLGLFAMEAMWTRYLPQADIIRQLLESGAIGEVTYVTADFGFVAPYDPTHRLFAPALGGGALLDAGVYPVSFIESILGAPRDVTAVGSLAPTGVDDHVQLTLRYDRALAAAATSLRSALPVTAVIAGTGGRIEVHSPYIRPSGLTVSTRGMWGPDEDAAEWVDTTLADPYDALHYEAEAAARYIVEGRTESPLHDHAATIAVIAVLEDARRQLGAA